MKDSRLGTYGTIGMGLLLAVKFFALQSMLSVEAFGWAVALKYVSAHSLSRLTATTIIGALPYAREDLDAKAKPIAQGITTGQLAIATLLGLLPLLALVAYTGLWIYLTFLIPLALVRWRLIGFSANGSAATPATALVPPSNSPKSLSICRSSPSCGYRFKREEGE